MRVVIIGENKSVHIQKWIEAISYKKGVELHVISFDRGVKFENVFYYPLHIFFNNKLDYFINIFRIRKYVREIKPTILHSHYASSYGFLGAVSGFHPYIITGWGADIFDSPKNFIMKKLLQFSFKKADAITVLTEVTRKEMLKLSNKHVHLIPFGVDLYKFKPQLKKTENSIIRIGTIRTLSEKYGVEYLIRAFAICKKTNSNIHLDIVGDGPLKIYLQNLVKELSIDESVTFYGYINQNESFEQYYSILSKLDVFAILSILDSETFGVACVEASACGIPIIASNVGGLVEVVKDEVTGLIVPPKNSEATAKALNKLIENEELRSNLGINGLNHVIQNYNWENNVDKMIQLYNDLAKNVSFSKTKL